MCLHEFQPFLLTKKTSAAAVLLLVEISVSAMSLLEDAQGTMHDNTNLVMSTCVQTAVQL